MSSLWTNLLFLHGHITDVGLARRLADAPKPAEKPRGRRQREEAVQTACVEPSRIPPCGGGACATT